MSRSLDRRSFLASTAAAGLIVAGRGAAAETGGLRDKAGRANCLYGCAVVSQTLRTDPEFAAAVMTEADILVPEAELKRIRVQRSPGQLDFWGADFIADFAARNGMKMRGHTLVWKDSNPDWLLEALATRPVESLMTDYIEACCRRYVGRIQSWDVVNEAIEPNDGRGDGLRTSTPWYQAFGEGYIETAFAAARNFDPTALLFYNDYSLEMVGELYDKRRDAVLKLLERLKKKGVPIDGLGIQSHLKPFKFPFDGEVFGRFLEEVQGLGLKIMITEFDIADHGGPIDIASRDKLIADVALRFTDTVLNNSAVIGILTWGLSDRYSWLSSTPAYKWPDGQLSRGLPLDQNLVRKPFWYSVAQSLDRHRGRLLLPVVEKP